jgi:uroporphyrinogen-III synthase
MVRVFISREPDLTVNLNRLISAFGCELQAVSQIQTTPVDFINPVPLTSWVFFYSPKAVKFFFDAKPVFINMPRFGAISSGTAAALAAHVQVDFEGQGTDTEKTARYFSSIIAESTVLTPQSDISLDILSQIMGTERVIPLVCYQTREKPVTVGFPDVLVFSSPANVRSFFRANRVLGWQKMIAYGPSTAAAIRAQGYEPGYILDNASDESVAEAIIQAIKG